MLKLEGLLGIASAEAYLPAVVEHGLDLDLRVDVGKASRVPILLVMDLLYLAHDCLGAGWLVR
jgi:hypothetical protein